MNSGQTRLQAALLCEEVITDSNGRYTIKNEFSQYSMGYSQPFTVFTIWRGDSTASDLKFRQKWKLLLQTAGW